MKLPLHSGMEVLVLGAGRSGISATTLLHAKGFSVRVLEKNPEHIAPEALHFLTINNIPLLLGEIQAHHFSNVEAVVISPGIPLREVQKLLPKENPPIVLGELELGYTFCAKEPIIAITATAGKTTTTSLITDILRSIGLNVFVGGNIGTPLCEYIYEEKKADVLVLEVSSFQLQTIHYFQPKVALIMNISPNHLDYHQDMDEYIRSKMNITKRQTKDDFLLLGESLRSIVERYQISAVVRYCSNQHRFSSPYLIGEHNAENIEFAYQATRIFGASQQQVANVVSSYKPLPHRLEHIGMVEGVCFINDSKATTPESLSLALQSIEAPIILLAGGKFKGGDLLALRDTLRDKVKKIVLFGASKEIFLSAWSGTTEIVHLPTLVEAVLEAKTSATSGDTVLLSPATSSFDAFSSYIERGEAFRSAVFNTPTL